jgi:TonB family protein
LLAILFWMNPFIWFFRESVKSAHEYSADQGVIQKGHNATDYMEMMLNRVFGVHFPGPVHSFNKSQLKNRIIMMTNKKNNRMAGITSLIAWPLVAMLVVLTTGAFRSQAHFPSNGEQLLPDLTLSVKDYINPTGEDTTVFTSVDEMPQFSKGGQDGLMQYIAKNVKYPEKSRKEGIQGKVFISFLVDTDGKVKDVTLLRIQSFKMEGSKQVSCEAPDMVEESLRVIKSLPDFTPGKNKGKAVKVKMTVPIQYKLSEDEKK